MTGLRSSVLRSVVVLCVGALPLSAGATPGFSITPSAISVYTTVDGGTTTNSTQSYLVALASQPTADVTVTIASADTGVATVAADSGGTQLTFTAANWFVPQSVTVTAVDDADDTDSTTSITHTASGGDYGSVTGSLPVTAVEGKSIWVHRVQTRDYHNGVVRPLEGGTSLFYFELSDLPTGDVTLTFTSSSAAVTLDAQPTDDASGNQSSMVINTSNWLNVSVGLVLTASDNNGVDELAVVDIAASGGGFTGVSTKMVVHVDDDDTPALLARSGGSAVTSLSADEGDSVTYALTLATQPASDATVSLTSTDTSALTVSPASMTFTTSNWSTPQTVTVTAEDDDDATSETPSVDHSVSGPAEYSAIELSLEATLTDDDTPGVTVSSTTVSASEDGATTTYTLVLDTEPTAEVTITPTSSATGVGTVSFADADDDDQLNFTVDNWDTTQTVTVTGVDDDVVNASDRTATISHAVAGGDYETVTADDVTFTATDDETAGVTVSSTTRSAAENGGTATYTLVLTEEPDEAVTITPSVAASSVATISFGDDDSDGKLNFSTTSWDTAQTVTITAVDDTKVNASNRTTTISHAIAGSGYGSVSVSDVGFTAVDNEKAGVTVSESDLSASENGGTATYTVVLTAQPDEEVTITPSSGSTSIARVSFTDTDADGKLNFTTSNGNTAQTVTITGVDDSVVNASDRETTITHTISGSGYGSVSVASVDFTATDNDTAGVTVTGTDLSAVENGGTATYTLKLNVQPNDEVTITPSSGSTSIARVSFTDTDADGKLNFTTSNWNTAQTVTVTGADDSVVNKTDRETTITHTISGGGYGSVSVASVDFTATDNETAGVTVTGTDLSASEDGGTATYTVVLTAKPDEDVTITPASAQTSIATVSFTDTDADGKLNFTTSNWSTAQTVTVTGVDDSVVNTKGRTTTITNSISGSGYGSVSVDSVEFTATDDETAAVTMSSTDLSATEKGGTASYTVVLAEAPDADVTVTPSVGASSVATVSFTDTDDDGKLNFTTSNWNTVQTVTITAVDDAKVNKADRKTTITHAISGSGYGSVSVSTVNFTAEDDETASVTVTGTDLSASEDGGTATYTVVLTAKPDEDVTITPTSGSTSIAMVSFADTDRDSKLNFTTSNWNTAQTVTVRGVDDSVVNKADREVTITHAISGSGYGSVSVASVDFTATDDETAGVTVSSTDLSASENDGAATYTLVLTEKPDEEVTITPASGSTAIAKVSFNDANDDGKLNFTTSNWDTAQTVTVTGVDDSQVNSPARETTISHTIAGSGYDDVSVSDVDFTASDDESPGVTASSSDLSASEDGGTTSYTLVLTTQPDDDVTITLSVDASSVATVSFTDTDADGKLNFTTSNWNTSQTVTVTGVNDSSVNKTDREATISHAVVGGGYDDVTVSDVDFTATDDEVAGVTITGTDLSATENAGTATYTVVLNAQPDEAVTITPTSGSTGIATVSFADTDADGKLNFTTSNWNTAQTVTVTGVDDSQVNGTDRSTTITHTAAGSRYGDVSVSSVDFTATDDETAGVTVVGTNLAASENGGTATYTLVLTAQPAGDVTITPASSQSSIATVSFADTDADGKLNFTTSNWNTAQTVTVTGVDDSQVNSPNRSTTITHSVSGGGYGSVTVTTVTVTARDNETPAVTVGGADLAASENGGTATYTVALAVQPGGDVTVEPNSASETVAKVTFLDADGDGKLNFTTSNWATAQTVTVTGVDDSQVNSADRTTTIGHTVAGGGYALARVTSVDFTAEDDETPAVTVTPTGLSASENGGTGTYTVVLTAQPDADVTLTPTVADDTVATASFADEDGDGKLNFSTSSWSTAQTITVTGVDDSQVNSPNRQTTITHAIAGGGYGSVSVASVDFTASDNEAPGVTVSASGLAASENGGTSTYTLMLTTQPADDVTITPSSGDPGIATVSFSDSDGDGKLNFTTSNWDDAQTVTITAVDDERVNSPDRATTVSHAIAGGGFGGVSVASVDFTANDDETPAVTVSGTSLSASENGGTATYTVALAVQPGGDVTITPTSGRASVAIVSFADADGDGKLNFSASNWNTAQTVTITGVDDSQINTTDRETTVTHTVAGGGYRQASVASVDFTATDDEVAAVSVVPTGLSASENGGASAYTVVLGVKPADTVHVTPTSGSSDVATVSFADADGDGRLNFTTANWNQPQTVTVTGVDDNQVNDPGRETDITHAIAGGGYRNAAVATVSFSAVDDETPGVVVSATEHSLSENGGTSTYTLALTAAPTGTVTVTPASADRSVVTLSFVDTSGAGGLSFTTSNWSSPQTVTITGVDDRLDNRADRTTTISHDVQGGGYDGVSASTVNVTAEDDDDAGILLGDGETVLLEEGDEPVVLDYTIALTSKPSGLVTVRISDLLGNSDVSCDTDLATEGMQNTLIFPTTTGGDDGWNVPRPVRIVVQSDFDAEDDYARLRHTASGGGYDAVTGDLAVDIADNDQPARVTLSRSSLSASEGGGRTEYTLVLTTRPTGPVNVTPTSRDASIATVRFADSDGDGRLNFTMSNWDTAQTVTVVGVDDDVENTPWRRTTIRHVVSGGGYDDVRVGSVTVTAIDNDRRDFEDSRDLIPNYAVDFLPPASDPVRQGFIRVINHSSVAGDARIHAVDDFGGKHDVLMTIKAAETVHLNSDDIENGNLGKGLAEGIGPGWGSWRIDLVSDLDLETLAYMRTADGFLTSMHDTLRVDAEHPGTLPTFNPGSNQDQVGWLRLMNPAEDDVTVTITGIDDFGDSPGVGVTAHLRGFEAVVYKAAELESGHASGLVGSLGDGQGKWRLHLTSTSGIHAMSLLVSPTGNLTNLTTEPPEPVAEEDGGDEHESGHLVPMFPAAADEKGRQGFVRVVNRSNVEGTVQIQAFDQTNWEYDTLELSLDAGQTRHFNSDDLELGNVAKGIEGSTGAGEGAWWLRLTSELDLNVLSYIRTADGFVSTMHDVAPSAASAHRVVMLNPASNDDQQSLLRLVNPGDSPAQVAITATDDMAIPSVEGVLVEVPPGGSRMLTTSDLESGAGDDMWGGFGDGEGKWRLDLTSDQPVQVLSLLSNPTGHLTNLSTAPTRKPREVDAAPGYAPTTVEVTPNLDSLAVHWSPPATTSGRQAVHYIATAESAFGDFGACVARAAAQSCKIVGLEAATTYEVSVYARNGAGDGPASTPVSTVTNGL